MSRLNPRIELQGLKRLADAAGNELPIAKIATGEYEETKPKHSSKTRSSRDLGDSLSKEYDTKFATRVAEGR